MKNRLASITVKQALMVLVVVVVMGVWVMTCINEGTLVTLPDISVITDIIGGMSDVTGEFM